MMRKTKEKNMKNLINTNRIYIMLTVIFAFMVIAAPNFFNAFNIKNILSGACLCTMAAIGFTIVMICGHLDLSVAATINLGAVLIIGLQPTLGWILAILIGVFSGAVVGVTNGILVAKAKINSFIVTLGMMTTLQGFTYMFCQGGSLNLSDFVLADWLEKTFLFILTPKIVITILAVVIFEIFLTKTRYGKGFFTVGGNLNTAWLAGLKTDRYLINAFMISGLTAAIAGVIFSISICTALPNMGEKGVSPLMMVVASTIIGGTSMAGGKGSVVKTAVAVLLLTTLFNGLNCIGVGYEVQIFASGAVLAIIVLYEAYVLYKEEQIKGQRLELLKELNKGNLKSKV